MKEKIITVGMILDAADRLRDAGRKETQGQLSANDLCNIINESQILVDFVIAAVRIDGEASCGDSGDSS